MSNTIPSIMRTVTPTKSPMPVTTSSISEKVSSISNTVKNTISPISEKVSQTISPISEKVSQTISPISEKVSQTISPISDNIQTTISTSPLSNTRSISLPMMLFLFLSILLLIYNLYLYITQKTDIFKKHFGIDIFSHFKNEKRGAIAFKKSLNDTINLNKKNLDLSKGTKIRKRMSESPIERKNDERQKYKEDLEKVDSISSYSGPLQATTKGGFCYIGTDRTNRACVKISSGDICASKQIYPSMDICINPNLRK